MNAFFGRLGLIVALGCTACTSWQQVSVSPAAVAGGVSQVRVTRNDGKRMVVDRPAIVGDSLYGRRDGRDTVLALEEISRIAVRKPAPARNAAALTFVSATLSAALFWLTYFAAGGA